MYIVKIYALGVKGKYRIHKADGEWTEVGAASFLNEGLQMPLSGVTYC